MSQFDHDPQLSRFVTEYILHELPEAPDNLESPDTLNILGYAYCKRFEQEHNPADLEKGTEALEKAVRLAERPSDTWRHCVNNLGNGLSLRYGLLGDPKDLDRAIELLENALAHISSRDERMPDVYRSVLARARRQRFERTENVVDLERAQHLEKELPPGFTL